MDLNRKSLIVHMGINGFSFGEHGPGIDKRHAYGRIDEGAFFQHQYPKL